MTKLGGILIVMFGTSLKENWDLLTLFMAHVLIPYLLIVVIYLNINIDSNK